LICWSKQTDDGRTDT